MGTWKQIVVLPVTAVGVPNTNNVDGVAQLNESLESRITRALAAAPPEVAHGARVVDTDSDGNTIVLREGTNGVTCWPGNPNHDVDPPVCMDAPSMQGAADFKARKPMPTNKDTRYHVHARRGTQWWSTSDPYDITKPTIRIGPHWMIMWPFNPKTTGLPAAPKDAGAYIVWAGSPYAHVNVMGRP